MKDVKHTLRAETRGVEVLRSARPRDMEDGQSQMRWKAAAAFLIALWFAHVREGPQATSRMSAKLSGS